MNAGRNRRFITVQKRVQTQDPFGQPVDTWQDYVKLPADIIALTGREFFQAKAVGSDVTTRIMTRWYPGIKTDQRIICQDRRMNKTYDIEAVLPDRLLTQLEIVCRDTGEG